MHHASGVGIHVQVDKDSDGTVSLSEWKEVIRLAMSGGGGGGGGGGANEDADPDARAAGYALFKALFFQNDSFLGIKVRRPYRLQYLPFVPTVYQNCICVPVEQHAQFTALLYCTNFIFWLKFCTNVGESYSVRILSNLTLPPYHPRVDPLAGR